MIKEWKAPKLTALNVSLTMGGGTHSHNEWMDGPNPYCGVDPHWCTQRINDGDHDRNGWTEHEFACAAKS